MMCTKLETERERNRKIEREIREIIRYWQGGGKERKKISSQWKFRPLVLIHKCTHTHRRTPLYQAYRTHTNISCTVYNIHILTHVERELYGIIPIQDQNGTRDSWRVTLLFSTPDVIISRQRTYYRYICRYICRYIVYKYIIIYTTFVWKKYNNNNIRYFLNATALLIHIHIICNKNRVRTIRFVDSSAAVVLCHIIIVVWIGSIVS